MTDTQLNTLADQTGTLTGALANIADDVHTALTDLDQLAGMADHDPLMRGGLSSLRGRLESLEEYVADVQARTGQS